MSVNIDNDNYKFSIIMAVYNTQVYIKQAIDSIIAQSIGFKENVQLIIVDDGSQDKSLEIANNYHERYPENIIVIHQEHKGVSSARNNGLQYATGEYVNFLDSDDYLSELVLEKVYAHYEKYPNKFDLISIPMYYFGKKNGSHELNYKYTKDGITNLIKRPNSPQLSLSSSFIKRECFSENLFNEDLIVSEDSLFINKLLLKKMRYGMVKNVKYHYRLRHTSNSLHENARFHIDYYIPRLKEYFMEIINYSINVKGEVPKFIQYSMMYELQELFKEETLDVFEDETDDDEFSQLLKDILSYIDDDVILKNRNIKNTFLKTFIYYFKYDEMDSEITDEDVLLKIKDYKIDTLSVHKFWLTQIDIEEDTLLFKGIFKSYFDTSCLSIEAVTKCSGKEYEYHATIEDTENRCYLSQAWQYSLNFKIEIPLDESNEYDINLRVNYHKNGDNTDFDEDNLIYYYLKVDFKNNTKISKINDFFIKDPYILRFKNNQFHIIPYSTEFPFKFSVVMATYNTEKYLSEAIESVINQDIGFEDNVELIIVNDGSTDSSGRIALEYQEKYPENIKVINQENGGQASARNNGIKHSKGRYLNFLDSDDYLGDDVLSKVYQFIVEHEEETDIVAIPQMIFGRLDQPHILNSKFKTTRVIDLVKEPNNPQLASNSAFFKRELFYSFEFPTNVIFSEDAILVNKILLEKKTLGVISDAIYYYRKREDFTSTIDIVGEKKEYYTDKLKYYFMELIDYAKFKENNVPRFLQYMLIYDLQWVIEQSDLSILDSKLELNEFWYYLDKIMSYMDASVISNNKYIKSILRKNFLLYLKWKDLHHEIVNNTDTEDVQVKIRNRRVDTLSRHNFWMDIISIEENMLKLSGLFSSYFNSDYISVQAVKEDDSVKVYTAKFVKYTSRENVSFLGIDLQYKYCFDLDIPLNDCENSNVSLRVNYHKDGNNENFDDDNLISHYLTTNFSNHAKMSITSNYKVSEDYIVAFNDNVFNISKYSYKSLISNEFSVLGSILSDKNYGYVYALFTRFTYLCLYPFIRRMKRNKKIYLFMDRVVTADDNAMHLFNYAMKQKDNNKKYFVLSGDSINYKQVSKMGPVLKFNSFKHRLIYLFADKIISTHPYENVLNPFYSTVNDERELYVGLVNSKIYFIQHGVTQNNISDWMRKYDKNLSLIVTVNDQEKESFYTEGYGFDKSIIQTLGFPRYDSLENKQCKQILIIPTWRKYLRNSKNIFMNSDYFNNLNNLLNNEKFISYARDNGYSIVFKAHPELEKVIDETVSDEKYIDLLDMDSYIKLSTDDSYQDLFKNSSLMITDYSSVFFDFAYQEKPVIYYQPSDIFHYESSYFDYDTMGFGEVVEDEDCLVELIGEYVDSDCVMKDEFKERVDRFFKFNDKNNCKRVYDWINVH